jgi:histone arginine demethylase JMJD6
MEPGAVALKQAEEGLETKQARRESRYERRIAKAKRKEYPRRAPEQWTAQRCADRGACASLEGIVDTLPRISADTTSLESFRERFERPGLPVMITGATDAWPAASKWTFEKLRAEYGSERMKVGEDDDGYPVWVKLKHYLRYLAETRDDSPL